MLFNFAVVHKVNSTYKYRIGGSLTPEDSDKEAFAQVRDAYTEFLKKEGITLGDNFVIKENEILFVNIDIVTVSNVIKVLSKNLDLTIRSGFEDKCTFIPESCEPLFRMEYHRLFK